MHILLLAGIGFLVWYLVTKKAERPVWPWIGLGLLALPLLGHGRGMGGMMGRGMGKGMMNGGMHGMMGRGMMDGGMHGMMGRGGHMGMMAEAGPWRWAAMGLHVLVVVALIVAAVVLVRRFLKARAQANSPMAILQMRLVKGEVSPEEYEAIRSKLQG